MLQKEWREKKESATTSSSYEKYKRNPSFSRKGPLPRVTARGDPDLSQGRVERGLQKRKSEKGS